MKKLLLLIIGVSVAFGQSELTEAYLKEFAFLKSQKKALETRLESITKEISAKEAVAKKEINKLQNKLIAKSNESEKIEKTLSDISRDKMGEDENSELVDITISQALATLKSYKAGVDESKEGKKRADTEVLDEAFDKASKSLYNLTNVTKTTGEFYLPDGKKIKGDILKVGNIAAFGVSDTTSGVLAPAGEGHLKIWTSDNDDASLATAVATSGNVESLRIFLFENLTTEALLPKEKTILSVINSGGVVGWVLVALGLFAVVLIIIRYYFLNNAGKYTEHATSRILEFIEEGDLDGAKEYIKSHTGSIINILKATLKNIHRDREHIEDIVSENMLHESAHIDRYGSLIIIIAAVGPLLGLLGTVTGMISTFDIITEFGTGDPKLLSGGISEALVTTELGLIVAIPALVFGNILSGWANNIKDDMEKASLKVINAYKLAQESK